METRPKFLPSFIDLIRREVERSGLRALIPLYLIGFIVLGAVVSWNIPDEFWEDKKWDVSTAVYAGLMTFGGLVLALGWNAFSRMYEILYRGRFGQYLLKNKLLNDYLVHIGFMHFAQIVAIFFSGVGLVTILVKLPFLFIDRSILALSLGFTLYALKHSIDAVTAMNDLTWFSAIFEREVNSDDDQKITQLPKRGA